ncbi:hypothetical protein A8C56_23150 [Niabella ginsenosidivorans]|uniref:Uncharacterized protein n=1 Tax=Niabella ginsenosidivorans TaxID=1176587 RepID=A0A1A9I726_9BACT|nr:hypothetical protein [Niabella ginsenosidivorans]ANH83487.1 hypothetical protein A8C56_23150 [Niabella ginsenosidivorans]
MHRQLIKNTLKQGRPYKTILLALVLLWLVSVVLMVWMLFCAQPEGKYDKKLSMKHLSLDDMLLSFNELKLDSNATLINLQLKEISRKNSTSDEGKRLIADSRKKIYNNILAQKIKQPAKPTGFTIKPVPQ